MNYTVDKNSGAVLIKRSQELKEIINLKNDIKRVENKLDEILELLKGVNHSEEHLGTRR